MSLLQGLELDQISHLAGDCFDDSQSSLENDSLESDFVGFQSARGAPVSISSEAMERAERLLGFGEEEVGEEVGFKSARGASISVSDMNRAREMMMDDVRSQEETTEGLNRGPSPERERMDQSFVVTTTTFEGFKSARGASISVSEESMNRAKGILGDIEEDGTYLEETGELHFGENSRPSEFEGFKSARGASIPVSNKAKERAREMMADICSEEDLSSSDAGFGGGFKSARGASIPISNKAKERAGEMMADVYSEDDPGFGGFKSARGASIPVSDKAKERAREMMADICSEEDLPSSDAGFGGGFKSARGASIPISDKAKERAREMMADICSDEDLPSSGGGFGGGFKSARGASIPISDKAKERAREMMADICSDEDLSSDTGFGGFKSAKGAPITFSANAMQRAKNLMNEIEKENDFSLYKTDANQNSEGQFGGFCSARGNQIAVSASAMDRARKLLEDDTNAPHMLLGDIDDSFDDSSMLSSSSVAPQVHSNTLPPKPPSTTSSRTPSKNPSRTPFRPPSRTPFRPSSVPPPFLEEGSTILPLEDSTIDNGNESGKSLCSQNSTENSNTFRKRKGSQFSYPAKKKKKTFRPKPFRRPKVVRSDPGVQVWKVQSRLKKPVVLPSSSQPIQTQKTPEVQLLSTQRGERTKLGTYFGLEMLHNFSEEQLISELGSVIVSLSFDSAKKYTFTFGENEIGPAEMMIKLLESGANSSHVTLKWVTHHYGMIVWKLAGIIRSSWGMSSPDWLSEEIVLDQLKWRYDQEYSLGKRSPLRLLLERDEAPVRHMVLCVAKILQVADQAASSPTQPTGHILLTDGWYTVQACLDSLLLNLLRSKKIFVGLKLRVCGATLLGLDAVSPLDPLHDKGDESPEPLLLSLNYNGTRRAAWDSKLGFQKKPFFTMPIALAKQYGGRIPSLCVVVQRVYPLVVWVKDAEGASRLYSEADYAKLQQKMEVEREKKVHEWIERRNAEELKKASSLRPKRRKSVALLTDDELYSEFICGTSDPSSFVASLPPEVAIETLERIRRRQEEERELTEKKLREYVEDSGLSDTGGTPLLTLKISDDPQNPEGEILLRESAFLSIWRPGDVSSFREGQRLAVYNLNPYVPKTKNLEEKEEEEESESKIENQFKREEKRSFFREEGRSGSGEKEIRFADYGIPEPPVELLKLSMTTMSTWRELPPSSNSFFQQRFCCSLGTLMETETLLEFDAVVVVLGASDPHFSQSPSGGHFRTQHVFVCDDSLTLAVMELRGTALRFPLCGVAKRPVVMGFKNLEQRPGYSDLRLHAPVISVCERTWFSENVVDGHLVRRMEVVKSWVQGEEGVEYVANLRERVKSLVLDE